MATLRDALRNWAEGIYPTEAGIELLIQHGKAIQEDAPWIIEEHADAPQRPRIAAIDSARLLHESAAWSGGEQRIIRIAVSLLEGQPVNLNEAVSGLDRANLALVLATIAHAGGSHEHSCMRFTADGQPAGFESMPSLYPWSEQKGNAHHVPVDPMDKLQCYNCH